MPQNIITPSFTPSQDVPKDYIPSGEIPAGGSVLTPLTPTQAYYNTRLKYFGNEFTKVSCFSKPIFNPHGFEPHGWTETKKRTSFEKDTSNESRTDSIKRARDKVFEIAFSNNFDYFVTLTLDETKISRTNVDDLKKSLKNWLSNLVSRYGVQYVLCPEYHSDGQAIHFHGLFAGNLKTEDSGTVLVAGVKKPMKKGKAARRGLTGRTVYNLPQWAYGWSTAVQLDDSKEKIAVYITKYITKENEKILGKFYYSGGKGLKRSVPTEYRNYPFQEFDGKEVKIPSAGLSVKYQTF